MKAFLLFSTIVVALLSSCSTDASAKDNLVESEDYCINMYNGPKQNFITDLQIENEDESGFDLVFTITPGEGAYFASPYSMNNWAGLLEMTVNEPEFIQYSGKFSESPQSVEEFDEYAKDYVNWVKTKTSYTYHFNVLDKKDFTESGYFAFVVEPECNRYRCDFEIKQKDGDLTISQKKILIENLTN